MDATSIILILSGSVFVFGVFALVIILREWAWLNQWDSQFEE